MKTIIFSLLAFSALSIHLQAQESPAAVKTPHVVVESHVVVNPDVNVNTNIEIDTIIVKTDQDTSIIRIGNKEIQVIDLENGTDDTWCSDNHKKNRIGKFTGHWEGVELGFNAFDKTDYSMYNGTEFMSLNQGKSMEFNLNFYQLNIGLYKTYMGLVSGMGLSFNSYRFEEPYTLSRGSERTEPFLLETEQQ